jgi:hypothetical protein
MKKIKRKPKKEKIVKAKPRNTWGKYPKKKVALLFLLGLGLAMLVGCDKKDRDSSAAPARILGGKTLGETPRFNLPKPPNTDEVIYHDFLPGDGLVLVNRLNQAQTVYVTIKDVGQWFRLGTGYSGAFYYERHDGAIVIKGKFAAGKEYCVYQYVEVKQ